MVDKRTDEHIGLTTASGIAYDQLAAKSRGAYDAEYFNELLNRAAEALIRIAPVYLFDPVSGARRPINQAELLNAQVTRAASALILADGREVKDLSLLRSDLRTAITILKGAGLTVFGAAPEHHKTP
jgi:hypothetical protein